MRNVNANRRSTVADGNGKRAALGFAITTGDLADNQQLNETRWFRQVLDGGRVDPFSGSRSAQATSAPGRRPTRSRGSTPTWPRARYTGVQDYDDWRGARADRFAGYWDPDEAAPTAGAYAAFPRYPGLMERAQAPFTPAGLEVPWFVSRGNHDGLCRATRPPAPISSARSPSAA